MRCRLRIGRLVSHPCGRRTNDTCGKCGNPTCRDHMNGTRCLFCEGTHTAPTAPLSVEWEEMWDFPADDAAAFDTRAGGPDGGLHDLDS